MTRESFEERVKALRGQLFVLARTRLPDSECEDAVQNAALAAWTHLSQLKDESAFEPWIKRILLNECTQILRSRKRQKNISEALISAAGSSVKEDAPPVYEALEEMKPEDRDLLLLHHEHGYSIREMSQKLNSSEDVLKMRLYRARNRLRVVLISLLILLLGMAIAVGTAYLDIPWFLSNRRAEPTEISTDYRSEIGISYTGRYLAAEASDAIWDLEALELLFTYSLAGAYSDAVIVHSANIGVDGEQHDHIWVDDQILPVDEWADGKTVYTYFLDGWKLNGHYPGGSEDFLVDGKGETFFSSLYFDMIKPEEYETLLTANGEIKLTSDVFVRSYATGEVIEQGLLTIQIAAPTAEEWRTAYEEYDR